MKGLSILGSTGSVGTNVLRIVEAFPDVRVVVLSAYESRESVEAAAAAGAFAFLPKHCPAEQIRDTVLAAWRWSGREAPDR